MKFLRQKSIIVLLLVASIILLTYSSIIFVNAKPGRNTAINTANRIAKNDKGVTRIFNQHARIDDEGAILIAKTYQNYHHPILILDLCRTYRHPNPYSFCCCKIIQQQNEER